MQFSFGKKNAPEASASSDEKLKKAIERNRRKMASRQSRPSMNASAPTNGGSSIASKLRQSAVSPTASSRQASPSSSGGSLLERMKAKREAQAAQSRPTPNPQGQSSSGIFGSRRSSTPSPSMESPAPRATARAPQPSMGMSSSTPSQSPMRRPVTSVDSIEMTAPVKKQTNSSASVSYDTKRIPKSSVRPRKRSSKKKSFELAGWVVKGGWLFCGFLVLRLIFSEGGFLEYHDKVTDYDNSVKELKELKLENQNLMVELEKMREDSLFQKKLVRDHLGYIARNEYLVLFPN